MTDPRNALYCWRYRERKAGRMDWPRCDACGLIHREARGTLCSRCWEKLTPEGRAYKARRVRDAKARARARAATSQPTDHALQ